MSVDTGYRIREGSAILADRFADVATCECGETVPPDGKCRNVGACRAAETAASRQSLARGAAASSAPAAWNLGGRVD